MAQAQIKKYHTLNRYFLYCIIPTPFNRMKTNIIPCINGPSLIHSCDSGDVRGFQFTILSFSPVIGETKRSFKILLNHARLII